MTWFPRGTGVGVRRSWRRVAWLGMAVAVLTAGSVSPLCAQAVYGSISGTVLDNSGGALPGVSVSVTSVDRKTVDSVVTDDTGRFVKGRLLPGPYEVKAELTGFKTALVPNVRVSVDTQTPVNFSLEVGALSEEVTVTGGAPLLKTDRADVATTFETRQVTDLPVLDRNTTRFLLLTPGTQVLGFQHAASENPQGSVQIQVDGQHFSGTDYQLDGTQNRDPILGIIVINSPLESVQEMKITAQNYDAEFGATAGVVSTKTKSGTNAFRGSAFEFNTGDQFQARNPFTQPSKDSLPDTKRNQFGGSVGGPIIQNQWFFFGDYQGTRTNQGGSQLLSVPTAAARAGDLSAYGVSIYDPSSGTTPGGRSQFSGNVIPTGRLSPQALNILKLIPLPNQAGRDNGTRDNFIANGTETFHENSADGRVDGRISESLNLFGRYSFGDFLRDGPTSFGPGGGKEIFSLGGTSKVNNQSIAAGFDKVISSTLFTDVRFGFFRYKVNVLPFDYGTTPASDAGIPGLNTGDAFTSGLPQGVINGSGNTGADTGGAGGFSFGSGLDVNRCNCPLDQNEKQWQVTANLTKLLGPHTFKFGIDVRRALNLRVPSDAHRSGQLSFDNERTSGPTGGGLGLATFLLGDVTSFRRYVSTNTNAAERQWRHYYYAQDTWHVNRKVTLNYGLRLDVINPQTVNEAGNGGWLDLTTGQILVGGVGGVGLNGDVKNSLNWAPRAGGTYQINEKTVLRAGYGRSYDIGVFGSLFGHSVTQNLPVLSVQDLSAPNNFDRVFTLGSGPSPPTFVQVPTDGKFTVPNGVFTRALPATQRPPRVDAYNVIVQRQLTDTMSIEAGYVGNRSNNTFAGDGPAANVNQASIVGFGTLSSDQRKPFFDGSVRTSIENQGGAFGWTQGIDYFCNCGRSRYNSMQIRFTKRLSQGYSITSGYTLQHAKQDSGDYFYIDPDLNYATTDWDRKSIYTISLVADLPFGKDKMFGRNMSSMVDAIAGGWQFNTNTVIMSGLPYSIAYNDAGADRDTGPNRPDLIGNPDGPQTQDQWFNAAPIGAAGSAFGRPAKGTFGNMERNSLRGPGYWRVDASLFKNVMLPNNRFIQVRIEAFNLLNHVNLGLPDSTIGVPGNLNTNAGRINSTFNGNSESQRFFQFGLKFAF
jgi:hypothetical protein